jgi:hypothetical protein
MSLEPDGLHKGRSVIAGKEKISIGPSRWPSSNLNCVRAAARSNVR